jgi:hypothetical protein
VNTQDPGDEETADEALAAPEPGLEAGPNADVQQVHTNHVYRKLSVNNRHAAVTLAKVLGLLAAS